MKISTCCERLALKYWYNKTWDDGSPQYYFVCSKCFRVCGINKDETTNENRI